MTPDDDETPICHLCGEPIGVLTDALMIFQGQFFMNRVDQYAMFVLDPDTKYTAVEIENGIAPGEHQQAFIVDSKNPAPLIPIHRDCISEVLDSDDDDDDDEDPEDDDLDRQFTEAMERDFNPEWDDNDMLTPNERGR